MGLVVDRPKPPPWVHALAAFLEQVPGLEILMLPVLGEPGAHPKQLPWLLDRLYSLSRTRFDPFGELTSGQPGSLARERDHLTHSNCDILLWLTAAKDPHLDLAGIARDGVFSIHLGRDQSGVPFWTEVAEREVTTRVKVFSHDARFTRGRLVREAEIATLGSLYLTLNAAEPVTAAIRLVAELCLQLCNDKTHALQRLRSIPEQQIDQHDLDHRVSTRDVVQFVGRKMIRSSRQRLVRRRLRAGWVIGIRPNRGRSITDSNVLDQHGFSQLPLDSDSAGMADPFLCEVHGRDYLLFEDVPRGSSRGRIVGIELFGDGGVSEKQVILDAPHHVSYPCVVQSDGDLFLVPESAAVRQVDLYHFARFPGELEYVGPLLSGVGFVDTTPVQLNDVWYFFTTTEQPFLETFLFWSRRLDAPWHLHPASPISCSVRNSRSAGHLFWKNGRLFRPTQDCSVRYGYAIRVNEVLKLTPTEFDERQVAWLGPSWQPGLLGTHTWNESRRFQVVDGIATKMPASRPTFGGG